MKVIQQGSLFKVAVITGPAHNFLALEFASDPSGDDVIIEVLGRILVEQNLMRDEVLRAVLIGVSRANIRLGTSYRVGRIQYVSDDTPRVDVYAEIADNIVEYAATH